MKLLSEMAVSVQPEPSAHISPTLEILGSPEQVPPIVKARPSGSAAVLL